eukprot:Nitzschia sp. Nitz4//scaffold444_size6782//3273//4754//NITZ4_009169-RA/size6782-processed-gene-0.7-mRNA-1//-1//CDS//3329552046//8042//frame0
MSSPATIWRSVVKGKPWVSSAAAAPRTMDMMSAVTGSYRGTLEVASAEAIDTAIQASQDVQNHWYRDFTPMERGRFMLDAAQLLREQTQAIAELETADTARPIRETIYEAPGAADTLQWFAGLAGSVTGQHVPFSQHTFGMTIREPLGVTVGIGAWNYPLQSAIWKSAPALAFGNTMIFKPSEWTPQTALALEEIYRQVGMPEGVFQVVLGDGPAVGPTLVQDERVAKVSFTGSVPTGRKLYASAAETFKKVTLEMGGKSPLIIFDDANLDSAVTAAMAANWYSSGQVCSNGTRVFVQQNVVEAFTEQLLDRTQRLIIGDPMDEATDIGPMLNLQHMQKVQEYIRVGQEDDGATLLYGGQTIPGDGCYLEPAIFTDCTDDMRIVREEVFGMLMCVLPFETEEEAIQRANDTQFGLAAGVFTKDGQRAHRVVDQLQAGTTWINNFNLAPVELPWGGFKNSGLGSENGLAGVESWTRVKSVYFDGNETLESPFSA